MASRAVSFALLVAILLTGLVPSAATAATPLPLPDSMVAVGDSITQAASSAGSLGSDAPQVFDVPGFSVHHELRYLVDAGLTPYEALKTGTVNVGKFLNREDIGSIKTGSVSDMLLLNGNPLEDISQARNIEGIMMGNLWLSKAYIKTELKKHEKNK